MPQINLRELEAQIKSESASGAYYLYGADNHGVVEAFKRLRRSIVPDEELMNLHSFEGKNIDIEAVIEACEALPVFAERLCVTVCDLDLDVNKLPAAVLKELIAEIENLPDTTVLIFYSATTDICGGKAKPTAANAKLVSAVEKNGRTVKFDIPSAAQAQKLIESRCADNGASISRDAAGMIYERCRGDMTLILNEADKLSSYTKKITAEAVAALTPENDDTKAYEISDAIAAGNTERCLEIISNVLETTADPVYLLYIVTGSINDVYRARLAIENGRGSAQVMEDFGYAKNLSFRVNNAFKTARKSSLKKLEQSLETLMKADLELKSGKGDPRIILENAVVRLCTLH